MAQYEKQNWTAGMPITQSKMNHIEDGIYDAYSIADTANGTATGLDATVNGTNGLTSKVSNLENVVGHNNSEGLQREIIDLRTQFSTEVTNGNDAMGQIHAATDQRTATPTYSNLEARFVAIDGLTQQIIDATTNTQVNHTSGSFDNLNARFNETESRANSAVGEITSARTRKDINGNIERTFTNLQERLNNTDISVNGLVVNYGNQHSRIGDIDSRVGIAEGILEDAKSSTALNRTGDNAFSSIDARFETIENEIVNGRNGKSSLDTRFDDIEDKLTEAKISTVLDHTYSSIDERFETLETEIKTARGGQNNLDARIDAIDDITNNASIVSRVGTLEGSASSLGTNLGQVTGRVTTIENDLNTASTGIKARLTALDDPNTGAIKALQDADAAINTTIGTDDTAGLRKRIKDLETEVENGRDTYADLDARFDAVEAKANAAAVAETVNSALDILDARLDDIDDGSNATISSINAAISHAISTDPEHPDAGGLTERLTAAESAIAQKANISDVNSQLSGKASTSDLASAVSSLQDRDTIVISKPQSGSNYTNNIPNIPVNEIKSNADYLIEADDEKYYYWRYIDNQWELISSAGGGGTGNSSGVVLTRNDYNAINTKEENTDYFVQETDGYHHYRWTPTEVEGQLTQIEICDWAIIDKNKIKRYNMATTAGTKVVDGVSEDVTYLNLYQYNYDEESTNIDTEREPFAQIELPRGGGGSGSATGQVNKLLRIGSEVIQKVVGSRIVLRAFYSSFDASGSESTTGYATLKAGNTVVFSNRELSSCEDSTETPSGWKDNTPGYHEFDVTDYCGVGNTIFSLTVNVNGTPLGKTWRVNLTDLRLETDAPDNLLIMVGDTYEFPYTPIGAVNKELHITIDKGTANKIENTVSLPNNISGQASSYIINSLSHGKHTIEMQLSASIGGQTEYSNTINREYIWYDINDVDNPIIIASKYEGLTIDAIQYSTIEIPYQVYKKNASTIEVEYYLDSSVTPYQTSTLTNTNSGVLAYMATTTDAHSLKIQVDDVYITINLNITASNKNLSPVTGAVIDFDPTMLSNSAANRLPQWNTRINQVDRTFSFSASPNFNWSDDPNGGGYKKDSNGDKCFVIKAGSYITLDYPMFANDVFSNGAEMKIVFKTSAVRNADAVWYKNIGEVSGKTVGVQLSAHSGWLKTDKAVNSTILADEDEDEDTITVKGVTYTYWRPNTEYVAGDIRVIRNVIYSCITGGLSIADNLQDKSIDLDEDPAKSYLKKWLKIGQLDTEIIATNSYLYFPYSEEDKIELDININKNEANNSFIMSYEDGVPSKAYAYTSGSGGDKITHNGTIIIGSDDCDVYIYHLRYYVKSLTTDQILQNFIADGKDLAQKVERYDRNCIYWNPSLNNGEGGYILSKTAESSLDPIKLAERMPDVKILMLDTDVFTTGKKDFVMNSSLRCIHADGGNVYTSRGDEDNWLFINGFHAGQGTTSDNYGQSARNVDFLFEVDARHWPTKSKNMVGYKVSENPNYISTVIKGKDASEFSNNAWSTSYTEWTADTTYMVGDKVSRTTNNNGIIYSCTKAHTSEETFDARNWKEVGTFSKCSDWKADDCKVSLTSSSVPNNYFNLKVNVASSENVNNALFQKRYNKFLTYKSPAQAAQVAKHHDTYDNIDEVEVKNCMEFVPAILFVREHSTTIPHTEFNDTNWHFYALGNIGDSKKTDYTRAYDPDDMNEFTCENSDNNTNNGQFQSGVFTYQGHENAIETDYAAWNENTAYQTNNIVVYNGMVYIRTGTNQAELGENETYSWIAADWTAITYTGWTDEDPPYFAPRTNPNPMEYSYPITSSQWNVQYNGTYLNRKHMTLVTEEFDGDHSFEFRYACKGDYRDGDLINDTNGNSEIPNDPSDLTKGYRTNDDVQFDLNHDVMLAMYEWLVTADENQYRDEAPQWFVKNAMEFFYAYTHYYTMMDNRAKNTFWHFAKTDKHRRVSRPVPELFHIYEQSSNAVANSSGIYTGTFTKATGEFDPNGIYYTQYAFDLWIYDTDTAAGIDNNGALVFPYGKEDEDYRVDGEPSSGYAFNGAGSIFWRRLKNTFTDEIATVMTSAGKNCFDSEDLINEFDSFQNCFPEEIWRLDIERKYIRTYTGAQVDNSITAGKQNARFLMSMMQGRKKYQRRQWIRDQGFYFNSKYNIGEISVNKTEFNIVSPAGDHSLLAVQPDYRLHLTPYQDMYLNVVVGNGTPIPPIRAKANQEYIIKLDDYAAGNFAETRVYISGFKGISKMGNLAPMYPYAFTLNGLEHLKELDVGTDNTGYRNGNFTELPLTNQTNLPLLETLNIKNCGSLTTSIGLNTANNLRTVEAAGSSIGGISLPDYTQIEILHLPSTVTDLTLYGARFLKDFTITDRNGAENYTNLYKLEISNSDYSADYKENPSDPLPVDWLDIAAEMLEKQSPQTILSLTGLYSATIGNIDTLSTFSEAKENLEPLGATVELGGTINVTGEWSTIEKNNYESIWPIELNTDPNKEITRWKITYKYDDYYDSNNNLVEGEEIKTLYIRNGTRIPDIYFNGTIEKPTREPTVRYEYTFGRSQYGNYIENSGWKASGAENPYDEMPLATRNMTIETYFNQEPRRYQVRWFMNRNNNGSLVRTSSSYVEYGGGEILEAPTVPEIHEAGQETAIINSLQGGVVNYSIFTGWEKLPIEINPTNINSNYYDIYANWENREISLGELFADTSNLSPEQLFVYAHMSSEDRRNYAGTDKIDKSQRMSYTLGQDSIESGQMIIGPNGSLVDGILRLDMTPTTKVSSIQPMTAANDAFTIMIDYSFNSNNPPRYNSKSAGILMSCYYQNSNANVVSGFALYDNLNSNLGSLGPTVGFGDMFNNSSYCLSVGGKSIYHEARNVLVLRHPKNDPKLYIYSGLSSDNKITNSVLVNTITWSTTTNNAYINFGQLTNDEDTEYDNLKDVMAVAHGTIYQMKYWNKDLGVGECKRLAVWPHETVTYGIAKVSNNASNGKPGDNNPIPSLSLNTLTTSNYGHLTEDRNAFGWGSSTYRTIVNNHVILGLPIKLQAILNKPKIKYLPLTTVENNGVTTKVLASIASSQNDYLFFPSIRNLNTEVSNSYTQETNEIAFEETPYPWINSSNVTVYDYVIDGGTNGHWNRVTSDNRYCNLRFSIKPLNTSIRVFRETSNSFSGGTGTTIYAEILTTGPIEVGDIFIDISGNAYMYVSNTDINQLGAQVEVNTGIFSCANGGWIKSSGFWTRSMMVPDMYSTNTSNHAIYSNKSANLITGYSSNNAVSDAEGLGLNYSITI